MKLFKKTILGIESSCDETAAAVSINGKIASNVVYSQIEHKQFGGVVPELASRQHLKKINFIVEKALKESKLKLNDIEAISVSHGPGLIGPLLVGTTYAKTLAWSKDIPIIGVDHIKAHIFANFIENKIKFPFICLIVSGGHTIIFNVVSIDNIQIIGQTQDDALGEAFDKIGKILNLPYPSGCIIDQYAQRGNPNKYSFPDTKVKDYNMSFSGIKTAFLNFIKKNKKAYPNFIEENIYDIAASIQHKLIDMTIEKLKKVLQDTRISSFAIGGGVASNSLMKKKCYEIAKNLNIKFYYPSPKYCTDNAAMICKLADLSFHNINYNYNLIPKPRLY